MRRVVGDETLGKFYDVKEGYPVLDRDGTGSQSRHTSEEAANPGRAKGDREMNEQGKGRMKEKEERVQEKATPLSEVRDRWSWVESTVWTERMLEALENGIKGVKETKWFSLHR